MRYRSVLSRCEACCVEKQESNGIIGIRIVWSPVLVPRCIPILSCCWCTPFAYSSFRWFCRDRTTFWFSCWTLGMEEEKTQAQEIQGSQEVAYDGGLLVVRCCSTVLVLFALTLPVCAFVLQSKYRTETGWGNRHMIYCPVSCFRNHRACYVSYYIF